MIDYQKRFRILDWIENGSDLSESWHYSIEDIDELKNNGLVALVEFEGELEFVIEPRGQYELERLRRFREDWLE